MSHWRCVGSGHRHCTQTNTRRSGIIPRCPHHSRALKSFSKPSDRKIAALMRRLLPGIASAEPQHCDAQRRACLQRMRAHRPSPAAPVFRRIRFTWHCFVRVRGAIELRAVRDSNRHFVTCEAASPMADAQIFLKSGSKQDIRHEMTQRSIPCDSRMRGAMVSASATGTTCSACMRHRLGEDLRAIGPPRPAAYDNVRPRTAAQCSGSRATLGCTQCNRFGNTSVRTIRTRPLGGRAYSRAIRSDRT